MTFAEQVKIARDHLGLSQHAFAKEIKVSFSTINRWENGHNEPHGAIRSVFIDYCKKHSVAINAIEGGDNA